MIPEINLLPTDERESHLPLVLFLIGFIICILLFTSLFYFYFQTKKEVSSVEQQLQHLQEEITLLETRYEELQQQMSKNSYQQAVAYAKQFLLPTSLLLDEFITLLPNNGIFSYYRYTNHGIEIETDFATMTEAATYIANLNESQYVKDVSIQELINESTETEEETKQLIRLQLTLDIDRNMLAKERETND